MAGFTSHRYRPAVYVIGVADAWQLWLVTRWKAYSNKHMAGNNQNRMTMQIWIWWESNKAVWEGAAHSQLHIKRWNLTIMCKNGINQLNRSAVKWQWRSPVIMRGQTYSGHRPCRRSGWTRQWGHNDTGRRLDWSGTQTCPSLCREKTSNNMRESCHEPNTHE